MSRRSIIPLAAAAALALLATVALAKSYSLLIAGHATVTDQSHTTRTESIVVDGKGFAVYTLSGDSARHPQCTSSQCRHFWPPVTVRARARPGSQPGIKGKLGTWKHGGIIQLTLAGRPLYTFSQDQSRDDATGEGVTGFGGTWHVVLTSGGRSGSGRTTTTTTATTTGTATTNSGTTTSYSTTATTTSTPCVGYYC